MCWWEGPSRCEQIGWASHYQHAESLVTHSPPCSRHQDHGEEECWLGRCKLHRFPLLLLLTHAEELNIWSKNPFFWNYEPHTWCKTNLVMLLTDALRILWELSIAVWLYTHLEEWGHPVEKVINHITIWSYTEFYVSYMSFHFWSPVQPDLSERKSKSYRQEEYRRREMCLIVVSKIFLSLWALPRFTPCGMNQQKW